MRKRIRLILFVFLSLCSCAENTEQNTIANGVNLSVPFTFEKPSKVQALEPYADVRGIDAPKTLAPGEYVPEDICTYWFNENTIFEGNEAHAADGKVIGSIGVFRQGNIHRQTAELGYYIAEEYWGKGIMTEAVRQICMYVFDKSDIIRIYAEPFAYNAASCRVLEKAGFQYEGTLRSNAVKNGSGVKDALGGKGE